MKRIMYVALAGLFAVSAGSASAAIITDGNVSLGVNDLGSLNVGGGVEDVTGETRVGLRYIPPGGTDQFESTSHGCECEGWGVGVGETGVSGYANVSVGTAGLTLDSFSSTATTATSVVTVSALSTLKVTHNFALASETDNLFRVGVTIENSGIDITDLLYRRTFDWDTSPTPFNEFVTIGGTAAATDVAGAGSDGFCSSNPFSSCSVTGDVEALGPTDHGANFDFNFGELASGESLSFDIFYGGADNKTDAFAALGEVGAEVYSLGWSGTDTDQNGFGDTSGAVTPTFIFGFSGVGGEAVPDPTPDPDPSKVPEPSSLVLLGLGLLGLRAARRRG